MLYVKRALQSSPWVAFAVDGKKLHWNSKCRNCVRWKNRLCYIIGRHYILSVYLSTVIMAEVPVFGRTLSCLNSIFRISIQLEYFRIGVSKLVLEKNCRRKLWFIFCSSLYVKCEKSRKRVLAKQKEENSTLLSILAVGQGSTYSPSS